MKRYLISFSSILLGLMLFIGCSNDASVSSKNDSNKGKEASTDRKLSIDEISKLNSADREKMLIEGAKKEGKLTWYTSLIVDQAVRPLADAFQKKYPFIKLEYYRGNNSETLEKLLNESRAQQYHADIIDSTESVLSLKKASLLQSFNSPFMDEYPNDIKDADRQWIAMNLYFSAMGYNTDMISKDQVPKTYEDLLDPRWKGKMAWNPVGVFGGAGFVGNIIHSYGEQKGMDYIQKLSKQNIVNINAAARAVLDRTIAGEYPIALHIFNNHAIISAKKGAPSNWQPLEPVLGTPSVIMLLKNAPNPYSAMLFIDFLLNKNEGQKILADADYLPAHPNVPAKYPELKPQEGKFKASFLKPEEIGENLGKWSKIVQDLFIK